jgi:hypothetical protein
MDADIGKLLLILTKIEFVNPVNSCCGCCQKGEQNKTRFAMPRNSAGQADRVFCESYWERSLSPCKEVQSGSPILTLGVDLRQRAKASQNLDGIW